MQWIDTQFALLKYYSDSLENVSIISYTDIITLVDVILDIIGFVEMQF